MNNLICPKFAGILAQLDADEDGVVLAAALASKRYLAARGLRWRDIAQKLTISQTPPRAHKRPNPRARDWRDLVAQCLERRDHLNERERRIIDLRYGLADGQRRTLEEVGKVLGMTRERARQIEAEALRHLRAPEVGLHLRDYLE